jgi:geranylgeranyl reductase family protein
MYDAIIVGGGPAGLNAAKSLGDEGFDVLVLERKKAVGDHIICTGIISEEAFREFGLSRDSILVSVNKFRWISPYNSKIEYEHPHVFAHVVDREKFDRNLCHHAQKNGVEVRVGREVAGISIRSGGVEVTVKAGKNSQEKYSSQFIIIATGISYNLQKNLGLGYPKEFLNGVQAELHYGDLDCTQVFVGRDIAPGAFAWLVPVGAGMARLGLLTENDPKGCFDHLIGKLPRFRTSGFNRDRVQYKTIAQGLVSKTYGDRVLTLGEAAGQVKTTTGGGIYFGLLCSRIAAEVLVNNLRKKQFAAATLSEYETRWKKAIRREILFGYFARKICSRFSDAEIEKMFYKAQTNGVIPLVRERGNFDWHGKLIFPLMRKIPYWQLIKTKFGIFNMEN